MLTRTAASRRLDPNDRRYERSLGFRIVRTGMKYLWALYSSAYLGAASVALWNLAQDGSGLSALSDNAKVAKALQLEDLFRLLDIPKPPAFTLLIVFIGVLTTLCYAGWWARADEAREDKVIFARELLEIVRQEQRSNIHAIIAIADVTQSEGTRVATDE